MDQVTRTKLKEHLDIINAILDSMNSIRVMDEKPSKYVSFHSFLRKHNHLVQSLHSLTEIPDVVEIYDLEKAGKAMLSQQRQYFDIVHSNLCVLRALLENRLGIRLDEIRSLVTFFQVNLRKAILEKPKREKQVQDMVETLLIGRGLQKGIGYDRERGRVKMSNKEFVPDFILTPISLAIEVKLSTTKAKSKEIVDQINADIRAYSQTFKNILFIVYDLGIIADEDEFKIGIESTDGISLVIVKH